MAENRWQVSTYITDEKVYNDLKVYLMENNVKMSVVLMAGLKAVLAGKIDLDGNVIAEAAEPPVTTDDDRDNATQVSGGDACLHRYPMQQGIDTLGNVAEVTSASAEGDALDNKMQAVWQAVVDAQQAAHSATFGNIDRAIDEWLVALTDALGTVIEDSKA